MGDINCGTQLKMSSVLTGIIVVVIAYRFVISPIEVSSLNFLRLLGDASFGIYFSHLAVMAVLAHIPYYEQYVFYPVNAIVAVLGSLFCVCLGKRILGKYSKFLAL